MDVFVLYLFVATATPLFLWKEHRKLAYIQIPFILAIWTYAILYLSVNLSPIVHTLFLSIFVGNVIFAHIAAVVIYAAPYFARRKMEIK